MCGVRSKPTLSTSSWIRSRDAPVEPVPLGRARRVVVLLGRVLGHEERVVEPAGREEPAAERAQPAEPFRLAVPRSCEADVRGPRERDPTELAAADVERAVDEHVEREAGAGAELEHADATF